MLGGFDRYFQIAPCFRDEDARADRSPGEFYQCDLEMSFVEQEDVLQVGEQLLGDIFGKFAGDREVPLPFARLSYREALSRYGTDKPDLRNPLQIVDVTDIFKSWEVKVFRRELEQGGEIAGIAVSVTELPPRKYFDDLIEDFTKKLGKGLGYLVLLEDGSNKGNISKFFSEEEFSALRERCYEGGGTTIVFLGAGSYQANQTAMGRLRVRLGEDFDLLTRDEFRFVWILDMPFYERDEKTGEIDFSHNPFSMPKGGLEALETQDPLEINAWQYDVVCNGYELLSGAIRNHSPRIMVKAFEIAGYPKEEVESRFPALMTAFRYGPPPHGGLAIGLERVVMLLAEQAAIRDIIPFPLSQAREDPLTGAPSPASPAQLSELGLSVVCEPDESEQ